MTPEEMMREPEKQEGLVSVLVTLGRDGRPYDVEVVDGRFSTAIDLYRNQTVHVGYINGGDSLDESHRHARIPQNTWEG